MEQELTALKITVNQTFVLPVTRTSPVTNGTTPMPTQKYSKLQNKSNDTESVAPKLSSNLKDELVSEERHDNDDDERINEALLVQDFVVGHEWDQNDEYFQSNSVFDVIPPVHRADPNKLEPDGVGLEDPTRVPAIDYSERDSQKARSLKTGGSSFVSEVASTRSTPFLQDFQEIEIPTQQSIKAKPFSPTRPHLKTAQNHHNPNLFQMPFFEVKYRPSRQPAISRPTEAFVTPNRMEKRKRFDSDLDVSFGHHNFGLERKFMDRIDSAPKNIGQNQERQDEHIGSNSDGMDTIENSADWQFLSQFQNQYQENGLFSTTDNPNLKSQNVLKQNVEQEFEDPISQNSQEDLKKNSPNLQNPRNKLVDFGDDNHLDFVSGPFRPKDQRKYQSNPRSKLKDKFEVLEPTFTPAEDQMDGYPHNNYQLSDTVVNLSELDSRPTFKPKRQNFNNRRNIEEDEEIEQIQDQITGMGHRFDREGLRDNPKRGLQLQNNLQTSGNLMRGPNWMIEPEYGRKRHLTRNQQPVGGTNRLIQENFPNQFAGNFGSNSQNFKRDFKTGRRTRTFDPLPSVQTETYDEDSKIKGSQNTLATDFSYDNDSENDLESRQNLLGPILPTPLPPKSERRIDFDISNEFRQLKPKQQRRADMKATYDRRLDVEKDALLHNQSFDQVVNYPNLIHENHGTFINQVEREFIPMRNWSGYTRPFSNMINHHVGAQKSWEQNHLDSIEDY